MGIEKTDIAAGLTSSNSNADGTASTEVVARAERRRFSAEYKLGIVAKAEACATSRDVGALLRQEGLYGSHLTKWRRECERGALGALAKKRGRKPRVDPTLEELRRVQRDNQKLRERLERAELIIDVQKKIASILGIPLNPLPSEGDA